MKHGENTMQIDYQKQATDFLAASALTFRAVYVGEDCPTLCEDAAKGDLLTPGKFPRRNHIHGSHYRLTISGEGRGHLTIDFWDSYHDAEIRAIGTEAYRRHKTMHKYPATKVMRPVFSASVETFAPRIVHTAPTPTAYDMLTCITKSDPGNFEDFCGDFGYDSDSRRAESVYQAIVKEWRQVSKFFTAAELTAAQEIN